MLPLLGAALSGLLAFLAGIFEDSESNAGSASNPNSQVQLAPQIGHRHRYFNKAISGEPPANALWVTTAATVAVLLSVRLEAMGTLYSVILSSVIGALVSALLLGLYGILAHISRIASMRTFRQPLYWDAIFSALPLGISFGFLTAFSLTLLSFTAGMMLNNPFSVPLIALLLGITIGSIGSATGDIHYGAERLYQHYMFGSGIPIAKQGDIDIKGEYGYRNSVDTPYFTLRFGAMVTAFAFGLLIFLDSLSRVFDFAGVWTSVIVELGIILIIFIVTVRLEKYTRDKYGPFMR
ncbi:tetrahydromethanopterin S-methyltransferase, subunit E [Candidatus Methanoperedens nitroreducens]|uniref:Tetrahydromethanopterin S-methyltransferase subunit E n=1 Tax=Candidatus Methanoperedens nitratireducens TaxID=1392998 RepID=A0A062UZX9_9EURY|nr:tetrahydromethanopterin S-methyltransferase subunit E [Candidatus Methanoperedens nitroreducens]KCZ72426.1 tetrahydromethanopterin S-methyltransferase, subunit E [Candidatus Methanoperedens nitroreducens]MDJ1423639.1 tetrahydromethanopterin S-methyltransferase subunit E [Candidatus Methanoperedens sp.]